MMTWTILGSGTHVASSRRGSPGHLLRAGKTEILVDCGAGAFHGIARAGSSPSRIAGCLVTHLHPDHVTDLAPLLFRLRNIAKEEEEEKTIYLFGPSGLEVFVNALRLLHVPFLDSKYLKVEVAESAEGEISFPGVEVRSVPVAHGVEALAYSFQGDDGRRVVYSGDTGRSAELIRFARGAELLVIEASFPNGNPRPFHLTPAEAAVIAAEAEVGRVVLVHLNPECDDVDLIE